MLDEEQIEGLSQGINLFNQAEFFEAHEYFELLWQAAGEDQQREQFLFLVRLAAAGVHLKNSNFSSLFLLQLAQKQLLDGLELTVVEANELALTLPKLINRLENSLRADLEKIAGNTGLELKLSS